MPRQHWSVPKRDTNMNDIEWRRLCISATLRNSWRPSTFYRYIDGIACIVFPTSVRVFLHSEDPNVSMSPFLYLKQEPEV